MKLKGEPVELIAAREEELGYERNGADHKTPKTQEQIEEDVKNLYDSIPGKENASEEELAAMRQTLYAYMGNAPYLEGAWMTKHNGIYYLQYAFPGTQYNVYGDAVYISDSPLGPFKVAENNPYSYKPTGFITGAGHGSTVRIPGRDSGIFLLCVSAAIINLNAGLACGRQVLMPMESCTVIKGMGIGRFVWIAAPGSSRNGCCFLTVSR